MPRWEPRRRNARHDGLVRFIAATSDGKRFISGADDNTVRVWETETWRLERLWEPHPDGISALSVSPSGKLFATGGEDGMVKVWALPPKWNLAKLPLSHEIKMEGSIAGLTFCGNEYLAFGLKEGTTGAIRLAGGVKDCEILHQQEGQPGGVSVVAGDGPKSYLTAGKYDTVKQWDLQTGKSTGSVTIQGICCAAPIPLSGGFVAGSSNGGLFVYDASWRQQISLKKGTDEFAHEGGVNSVSVTQDGLYIVSGGNNNTAKIWHRETGEFMDPGEMWNREGKVFCVTTAGKYAIAGGEKRDIMIWDLPTKKME